MSNVMRLKLRHRLFGFCLLCFGGSSAFAIETTINKLALTYAIDTQVCRETGRMLLKRKMCRPYDGVDRNDSKQCSPEEADQLNVNGNNAIAFAEVATNQYGYTHLSRAVGQALGANTIIYVDQFQGDNNPRKVETWQVRAEAFNAVLALPPGPFPYNTWITQTPKPPKDIHAAELAAVLQQGQKLSDEWSSVVGARGRSFVAVRECRGSWAYGIYACGQIIKLTLKQLSLDGGVIPYCQFTKPRKK